MSPAQFRAWMLRYKLSLSAAAAALHYGRRQIVNFRNGTTAIGPRVGAAVEQATLQLTLARGRKRALNEPKRGA